MLATALLLVAVAAASLGLGVVQQSMEFVFGTIVLCLVASVVLAAGVLRNRPRGRVSADAARRWSGAGEADDGDEAV